MRIGVYVGSFDPVHKGHIKVVNHLLDNHYINKCLIIPTLGYWDKRNQIDIKDRINMLKIFEKNNIIIDTKNNKLEYTYQVLNSIKKEYPNDILYLIIGNDLISELNKWKNIDEILNNKVIVLQRIKIDSRKYIKDLNAKEKIIVLDNFRNISISSTEIRSNIKYKSKKEMLKVLDERVYDYIINNKLY